MSEPTVADLLAQIPNKGDSIVIDDMRATNMGSFPLSDEEHPSWCKCQRVCGGDQ